MLKILLSTFLVVTPVYADHIGRPYKSVGLMWTFDNVYLPQTSGDCIGIDVCTVE